MPRLIKTPNETRLLTGDRLALLTNSVPHDNAPIIIDAADHHQVADFRFSLNGRKGAPYVRTWLPGRKCMPIQNLIMAEELAAAPTDWVVDHLDHNPLNNVRSNLEVVSPEENRRRRRAWGKTSAYRGVWRHTGGRGWVSALKVGGVVRYRGYHQFEEDAARAYNRAALTALGPVAQLNVFPVELAVAA